jgi:hypothetical protein
MTTAEKAQRLINLTRNYQTIKQHEAAQARADYAGKQASYESWKREEESDGWGGGLGISRNPYTEHDKTRLKTAEEAEAIANELAEFVVDHFTAMIPDGAEHDGRNTSKETEPTNQTGE